ncbi:MAG: hypothetical protein JO293_04160, partial [Candidatus Eremiobacteraeota bacterium]|nr:hypothetical protein [Candidatus Eremiobacteraeota bacterium]
MTGWSSASRPRAVRCRGYTLFEALIAVCVLLLLLFVVSDAVQRMLHNTAMSSARAEQARTANELVTRLNEEARSSTAVFIPANDVLGNANGGFSAHEVDFFRKLSAGGDAYVAYRLDETSGTVTRYEYSLVAGAPVVVHADEVADGIESLVPRRTPAGSLADVVSPETVSDVSLLYGTAGVVGGNDIVIVDVQGQASNGVAPAPISVHLASRAAPTSLAVLAPAAPPPPPGGGPITIPFIIRGASPMTFHVPHGPWHSGGPVDNPDSPDSGIHTPTIAGLLMYIGPAGGFSYLDLFSEYPVVESGTYTFVDSS